MHRPTIMTAFSKTILLIMFTCFSLPAVAQLPQVTSRQQAIALLARAVSVASKQELFNYLGSSYLDEARVKPRLMDSAFFYLRKSIYLVDSVNTDHSPVTDKALDLLA